MSKLEKALAEHESAYMAERVANGIALLDREGPEGWRERIDCDSLDLADGCNCVLGQVYGDFWPAIAAFAPTETRDAFSVAHAFAVSWEANASESLPDRYAPLTAAWRRALDCDGAA